MSKDLHQSVSAFGSMGIAVLTMSLAACGGGSGSTGAAVENTGTFIDSPVSGINYQTETQTGTTGEAGDFLYLDGESITFSIGEFSLSGIGGESVSLVSMGTSTVADAVRFVKLD